MAAATNHRYTCKNGSITYLGNAGCRGSQMYYFPASDYLELFCSDENMGYILTVCYDLQIRNLKRPPQHTKKLRMKDSEALLCVYSFVYFFYNEGVE